MCDEALRQALRDCQTLTPILLTGEQAIERLREINVLVYRALERPRAREAKNFMDKFDQAIDALKRA